MKRLIRQTVVWRIYDQNRRRPPSASFRHLCCSETLVPSGLNRTPPPPASIWAPSQIDVSRSAKKESGLSRGLLLLCSCQSVTGEAGVTEGIRAASDKLIWGRAKCRLPPRLWNRRSQSVSNNASAEAEWRRAPGGQRRPTSVGLLMGLFSPKTPRWGGTGGVPDFPADRSRQISIYPLNV